MNPRNVFAELQRRNVIRMAGLYLVGAWLLTQVASTVLPMFGAPEWLPRSIVILLAIGFVPALIFSWVFELTPQGLKRDEEVPAEQSIAPQTARRMDRKIIVVLLLALGYFAFDKFVLTARREATQLHSTVATNESAATANNKSIAVLPFENLSSDKENAYFAEGIQDEILTRLSKIAALKVISRTSTQKYKSAPDNLREVGKQLGVANLLEGSVQKIGNAVLVNVQLIRVATDEHLWAESYNRKLDDVFEVEGEVAGAIAEQLNARLTGAEQKALTDKPTQSLSAYDAYLRGLSIQHNQFSLPALQQAAGAYSEAVQLDPKFALAWARLAVLRSNLYFVGVDTNTNSAAAVKEAADQVMALQPDLAEAWVAQAAYRYRVLRDFPAALQAYEEGGKRAPNNSFVFAEMSYLERRLGLWKEADAHYKRATELDPRNVELLGLGGNALGLQRRYPEAHAAFDRALEISPKDVGVLARHAELFQAEGRLDEAAKMLARIGPDPKDDAVLAAQSGQAILERRFDDAIGIIQKRIAAAEPGKPVDTITKLSLTILGYCQEWAGRKAEARQTFARAIAAIKPSPDTLISADSLGLPYNLALAYAGLGDKQKALDQAKRALADYAGDAVAKPNAEAVLAQIQARFGDLDSAITALPHLLEVPAGITVADLKLNPLWDPLRKDPRFQKLVADGAAAQAPTRP